MKISRNFGFCSVVLSLFVSKRHYSSTNVIGNETRMPLRGDLRLRADGVPYFPAKNTAVNERETAAAAAAAAGSSLWGAGTESTEVSAPLCDSENRRISQ